MKAIKSIIKKAAMYGLNSTGNKQGTQLDRKFPPDFSQDDIDIIEAVIPYTMTSPERIFALIQSVKYIVQNNICGDIVECGVWRGGSMMAVAQTLARLKDDKRHLYLFDTFEGMTEPTDKDMDFTGNQASRLLENTVKEDETSLWCCASIDSVQSILESVGYDTQKIHLIKGRVENTLPSKAPQNISLLRLDTDWYESTRHELIHLFPRLSLGGVIIIDDYGFWKGSRLATDEYIDQNNVRILLNRIDETGRIAVKL